MSFGVAPNSAPEGATTKHSLIHQQHLNLLFKPLRPKRSDLRAEAILHRANGESQEQLDIARHFQYFLQSFAEITRLLY